MKYPDIVEALARDGADVRVGTEAKLHDYIVKEIARWGDLIRRTNIHATEAKLRCRPDADTAGGTILVLNIDEVRTIRCKTSVVLPAQRLLSAWHARAAGEGGARPCG
jgi:hypothetical protein